MKYFTFILLVLVMVGIAMPTDYASARRGADDNHAEDSRSGYDDDSNDDDSNDDDDEDEDEDDRRGRGRGRDDSRSRFSTSTVNLGTTSPREVEANVYTDMTIVKVEMNNSRKFVFSTDADTRAEVLDAVVARLGLSRSEADAVLDFEVEDRASRAKERAKISGVSNAGGNGTTTSSVNNADIKARIKVLEDLIARLIALLNAR
jgi:hypothetical protein